ncbi:hypothetical protein M413DRAFT_448263 [Hebeloma cylindrosporum]|uniref:Nudix hydrolase domain-containing protein n=1 Tax=Hebeloma cylindrosporum TaxID=76867 RepID=A0A0C3C2A4_HEBCY|nr:hypothetical protein M413DRAFT_448263 [Hebeloma cylindrosporum h7]
MAAPRYPTSQYLAGNFVTSAGSVLFRIKRPTLQLEICVLHQLTRDEWLLPKGRKDRGESIEAAALRETYEETGYRCTLWPQRMATRAPAPGINNIHHAEVAEGLVEPMAVTIRELREGRIKMIFWFITVAENGVEKVEGSQMEGENFDSVFLDAKAAIERLTFQSDREVAQKALDIVEASRQPIREV